MKKQIITTSLAMSLLIGGAVSSFTPHTYAAAASITTTGTIVNGSPYFHKTPVSGEATMGFVKNGAVVEVVEVTNNWWVKIKYNGVTGWVSAHYIDVQTMTTIATPKPTAKATATPTATATPKPTVKPTATATPKPTAKPTATTTPKPTTTTASWEQKADKLIAFAESLQGKVQYQWGKRVTSNPAKMILDCSSYTQYVYKQTLGITMGWGANIQRDSFPAVAKKDLRKGDLVFFSVGTPGKIGHVGIYIGNGQFIHNVNPTKDVVISDLNSSYYTSHYIAASRPIQ